MSKTHILIPHRKTEDQAISETGTEGRQVYWDESRSGTGWKTGNQAENNAGTCGHSGSELFNVRGLNAGEMPEAGRQL